MNSANAKLCCAGAALTVAILTALCHAQATCPGSDDNILDCNGNGTDDYCDIAAGTSPDANTNSIPDECDFEVQLDPFAGFETLPANMPIHQSDLNSDGSSWSNPSTLWRIQDRGCPSLHGRALMAVPTDPPVFDTLDSESFFSDPAGLTDCTSHTYALDLDLRSEASLAPRVDWQIIIRDATRDADVVLIHLASTRSNFTGVIDALGGNGRGRILVQNPAGTPTFINTGQAIPLNTCYRIRVVFDNDAPADSAVTVFINDILKLTTARLNPLARRMDYFRIEQERNGNNMASVHRLVIDNVTLTLGGAPLDLPDCNANCIDDAVDIAAGTSADCPGSVPGMPDECELDCNSNGIPDACDFAAGTSRDCNTNGRPDECDVSSETSLDCNRNQTLDECELRSGAVSDCNGNRTPDDCDVGPGSLDWRWRRTLTPRAGHAMAYDSARGVTVLIGGYPGMGEFGPHYRETWEWNGSQWALRATTGPKIASRQALSYDAHRRVSVICGDEFGSAAKTWEWDGWNWAVRYTSIPSIGTGHATAYDNERRVTVLFEGAYNRSDTWEWDGANWSLRSSAGPSPRTGQTMAYDIARGVTLLYGGRLGGGSTFSTELWEWNGAQWGLRSTTGPAPAEYKMTYDSQRDVAVLVGGGQGESCETWEWNGAQWSFRGTEGPPFRYEHAVAYDTTRGVTVLFGGTDFAYPTGVGGPLGDTWVWDGNVWTQATSGAPAPGYGGNAALVYDRSRAVSVAFVGNDPRSGFGQTAEWNGDTWTRYPDGGPSERSGHAMAYDDAREVTVLFGGDDGSLNGETWEWNGEVWALRAAGGPPPRCEHAVAYDNARTRIVLFGGRDAGGLNGETWAWDGQSWDLLATEGPAPRQKHFIAYDRRRARLVLYGGETALSPPTHSLDTWEWDGNAWELRTPSAAPLGLGVAMAFDDVRGLTVLASAATPGRAPEIWEWDGNSWTPRKVATSPSLSTMTYDIARRAMVAYDTSIWELTPRSADRNFNSVPDDCLVSGATWRTHASGLGSQMIPLNLGGPAQTHGVVSEPRDGGIHKLRLAADRDPGVPTSQPVVIEQRACNDLEYADYTGASVPSASIEGHEWVLEFAPALENGWTYRLTLPPTSNAPASPPIEIRCLAGDINSDGRVNALDRSFVVAAWTGPGFSPASDINLDGRTNAADRNLVLSIWIGTENCAP